MIQFKRNAELNFWRRTLSRETGTFSNDHYEWFYTHYFGLSREDYAEKRVLDVGCGPRGSLEWANMAAERVGLDPLVGKYRALGIDRHAMRYVEAPVERIPFPDGYFDIVTSFNSLDHVDDLNLAISEITRVMARGGLLLLITDVNHKPTATEPISFGWSILENFLHFEILDSRQLEKSEPSVYLSVERGVSYTQEDQTNRYGILTAKLRRR